MAITLVTTVGSKTANSFCTVVQADSYISGSLWSTADKATWSALTDDAVAQLLYMAGILMRGLSWAHYPVYEQQAMPHPRCYLKTLYDRYYGYPRYDTDEIIYVNDDDSVAGIPDDIKKAQAYIAYDIVWRGLQSRSAPSDGVAGDAIERLSLFGDVSIGFSKGEVSLSNGSAWEQIIKNDHFEIDLLLSPYQSTIGFISANERWAPELEDEVA